MLTLSWESIGEGSGLVGKGCLYILHVGGFGLGGIEVYHYLNLSHSVQYG